MAARIVWICGINFVLINERIQLGIYGFICDVCSIGDCMLLYHWTGVLKLY